MPLLSLLCRHACLVLETQAKNSKRLLQIGEWNGPGRHTAVVSLLYRWHIPVFCIVNFFAASPTQRCIRENMLELVFDIGYFLQQEKGLGVMRANKLELTAVGDGRILQGKKKLHRGTCLGDLPFWATHA